ASAGQCIRGSTKSSLEPPDGSGIAVAKGLRNYPRTPFRTPETLENKGVPTVLGEFLRPRTTRCTPPPTSPPPRRPNRLCSRRLGRRGGKRESIRSSCCHPAIDAPGYGDADRFSGCTCALLDRWCNMFRCSLCSCPGRSPKA